MREPEGDQRWAVIGLLLWTVVIGIVIVSVVYFAGHWIFHLW